MARLDGHWVAKRVGIVEHYKDMSLAEIVLFDAYLLLANKQTWECWRSIRQLEQLLPMKRHTIIDAKRSLANRGWIVKVNQTGVFIPKLYRYSQTPDENGGQNGEEVVQTGQHLSFEVAQTGQHSPPQAVQKGQRVVQTGQQKVPFGTTIIEDNMIIDDLPPHIGGGQNSENSGLSNLAPDERRYLHLLKSIANYPFSFEKDLFFLRELLVDFPAIDLEREIKNWKTWLLDKKIGKEANYRSRLRRWLNNSVRYMEEKRDGKRGYLEGQPEASGKKAGPVAGPGGAGRKGFDLPSDYPIDVRSGPDGENQGA